MHYFMKQGISLALILLGFILIIEPQWEDEQNKIQQIELMTPVAQPAVTKNRLPVVGKIKIEKIDLEMPIINGATANHLKVSACSVVKDRAIGSENNFVIAGHRGRSFGRHFNRLSELVEGDFILLTDEQGGTFTYVVESTDIVDQSEVSVLDNHNQDEVTLITCEPTGLESPTKRRIVKAIRLLYNKISEQ